MTRRWILVNVLLYLGMPCSRADQIIFKDDFKGKLGADWSWIREHREYWRISDGGLEVRVEPGNEWGPANNAKNLLVRPAPDASTNEIQVNVTFTSQPTGQYEQADLVWFFDEGHMVKIGREMVDGKSSIVMGREENDKTRTITVIPSKTKEDSVQLVLSIKGNHIDGHYRYNDSQEWFMAGECNLPQPTNAAAKISLQFYNGPNNAEHWVRVTRFQISKVAN